MLKEMLFTLDVAVDTGTDADRAAANRLQRKCTLFSAPFPCSTYSAVLMLSCKREPATAAVFSLPSLSRFAD